MTILRHGLTAADQGAMTTLRARLAARPVAITRASYDALLEQVPSADSVSYTEASIGGVPGVWCAPSTSPGKAAVLYLHLDRGSLLRPLSDPDRGQALLTGAGECLAS